METPLKELGLNPTVYTQLDMYAKIETTSALSVISPNNIIFTTTPVASPEDKSLSIIDAQYAGGSGFFDKLGALNEYCASQRLECQGVVVVELKTRKETPSIDIYTGDIFTNVKESYRVKNGFVLQRGDNPSPIDQISPLSSKDFIYSGEPPPIDVNTMFVFIDPIILEKTERQEGEFSPITKKFYKKPDDDITYHFEAHQPTPSGTTGEGLTGIVQESNSFSTGMDLGAMTSISETLTSPYMLTTATVLVGIALYSMVSRNLPKHLSP